MSLTVSQKLAVERSEWLVKLGPPPPWWRLFALRSWMRRYRAIMSVDITISAEMLRAIYPDEVSRIAKRNNATLSLLQRK